MALVRITLLGGGGVGKSCLTIRYCRPDLDWIEEYDPTVEDVYRRQATVEGEPVLCNIIDTAGQEEYTGMRDSWVRAGDGYVILFDVTDRQSFEMLDEIVARIERVRDVASAAQLPCVIVGNKSDLVDRRAVTVDEAHEKAAALCCEFVEASAKENIGVDSAFETCVRAHRRLTRGTNTTSNRQPTRKLCSIL